MNPCLTVHRSCRDEINEVHRIAFTRLRVISHSLAIETGRWYRRGRGRLEVAQDCVYAVPRKQNYTCWIPVC
ncbi:hypothetical protein E2C01_070998 [Portunus trituberculatus]|uniref:Uncharacterized protein n=1 Tax=Portunus trituberculatus TaxID=210409 RepID=A0A5B7HU83_PORTR|nr:hypothetical protein [Portunus trituberculatus]